MAKCTGHDLMTHFNLQPGPKIGAVLEHVEEAQAVGEIETKEQALEMASDLLKNMAGRPVLEMHRDRSD